MSKPALQLGRLSAVAQIAVHKPSTPADAEVDLDFIWTRTQVRRTFHDLESLADSIRESGVIQPILLHEEEGGRFRLIAGERRLRAAKLAGLTKIPARTKRGLTEIQIRTMQVAENNDRDGLTAYDMAQGVIEDVDCYGAEEAARIWNRGKAWISKRVATRRYAEPIMALLRDRLVEDLEVLHCLNEIHKLAADELTIWTDQVDDGRVPSRGDLRRRIAELKALCERAEADYIRASNEKATARPTQREQSLTSERQTTLRPTPSHSPASADEPSIPATRSPQTPQVGSAAPSALDEHWNAFLEAVAPALQGLTADTATDYLARLGELVQRVPVDQLLNHPKT